MDGTTGRPDGAGSHIWLRYTTQFKVGERINTIEIGVPVPLGASEETRERLFREATAGMDQLAKHVESHAARAQHAGQRGSTVPAAKPPAAPPSIPAAPAPANRTNPPPVAQPTSVSPPKTPAATPPREAPPAAAVDNKETNVPPTRHNIGASMPSSPGLSGNASESLKLPQFIQFIKDKLDMTPKEAMDRLNVKTLTGVNLREAFEQLQQMVNQEGNGSAPTEQKARETESSTARPEAEKPLSENMTGETRSPRPAANSNAASAVSMSVRPANKKAQDIPEIRHAVVREVPPSPVFDEELEDEELGLDVGDEEDLDYLSELTEHEREFAEGRLSKLREARGSSAASAGRLQALNNVLGEQLDGEQLQELIQGIWNVATLNKLKNDQAEALISWAKEDAFVEEAEVVLAFLQENTYARSDR